MAGEVEYNIPSQYKPRTLFNARTEVPYCISQWICPPKYFVGDSQPQESSGCPSPCPQGLSWRWPEESPQLCAKTAQKVTRWWKLTQNDGVPWKPVSLMGSSPFLSWGWMLRGLFPVEEQASRWEDRNTKLATRIRRRNSVIPTDQK